MNPRTVSTYSHFSPKQILALHASKMPLAIGMCPYWERSPYDHLDNLLLVARVFCGSSFSTNCCDAVGNWRVKETERMVAICTELQKVGFLFVFLFCFVFYTGPSLSFPKVWASNDRQTWATLSEKALISPCFLFVMCAARC